MERSTHLYRGLCPDGLRHRSSNECSRSDQRDWDFATAFGIDIVRTVEPPAGFSGEAYVEDGPAINSDFLNGLHMTKPSVPSLSGSKTMHMEAEQ